MFLATLMPDDVILEDDEAHRINRARLAFLLNKLPHEIDDAPLRDIQDLIAVRSGEIEAEKMKPKKG